MVITGVCDVSDVPPEDDAGVLSGISTGVLSAEPVPMPPVFGVLPGVSEEELPGSVTVPSFPEVSISFPRHPTAATTTAVNSKAVRKSRRAFFIKNNPSFRESEDLLFHYTMKLSKCQENFLLFLVCFAQETGEIRFFPFLKSGRKRKDFFKSVQKAVRVGGVSKLVNVIDKSYSPKL